MKKVRTAPALEALLNLPTLAVARNLLGYRIVTQIEGVRTAGVIVETEAYHGPSDPASHSFRGETPRTSIMFLSPGHFYVYFIYGMHWCVNVVTEPVGVGSAVLLRAMEPISGVETMRARRGRGSDQELGRGPARLCVALGIDQSCSAEFALTSDRIWLESDRSYSDEEVETSQRIGISKGVELPWRFYVKHSQFVSAKR